jgi:O-methyltransferase involved in polyketide biosynthesis
MGKDEVAMEKVVLTEEKETLLIPLYGKAKDFKKSPSILGDWKAAEIVEKIEYDFSSLNIPEKTNTLMCIRARMLDSRTRTQISDGNNLVLHLGCGLDSRYERLARPKIQWIDIDFPDVIELRRNFYTEDPSYAMVGSSVLAKEWIENLPTDKSNVIVAEGLLMYLKEKEIKRLFLRLAKKLGSFTIIFDAYSTLTARSAKNHPSLKKTGASINWGIDEPKDMESWFPGLTVTEEAFFTSKEALEGLTGLNKLLYSIAGAFKTARRAHRIITLRMANVPQEVESDWN